MHKTSTQKQGCLPYLQIQRRIYPSLYSGENSDQKGQLSCQMEVGLWAKPMLSYLLSSAWNTIQCCHSRIFFFSSVERVGFLCFYLRDGDTGAMSRNNLAEPCRQQVVVSDQNQNLFTTAPSMAPSSKLRSSRNTVLCCRIGFLPNISPYLQRGCCPSWKH